MNMMPSRKKGVAALAAKRVQMPRMKSAKRARGIPGAASMAGTEPQDNQMDDMARMMAANGGLQ